MGAKRSSSISAQAHLLTDTIADPEERRKAFNRVYYKLWREANKEKGGRSEYNKKYAATHKEEIAQRKKAYYDMHKEEYAQHSKDYAATHKEEIAQQKKAYYNAHREEILQRRAAYRAVQKEAKS